MGFPWKEDELRKLKDLIDKNYNKQQIAEELGRTTTAIQVKANRLGLSIHDTSDNKGNRGPMWRKQDDEKLAELWADPTMSRNMICKALHRSAFAIRKRALQLNLGGRDYDNSYLSIRDICDEMQVNHDNVRTWFRNGLKHRKAKSGKLKYLIDVNDLLDFLETHQDYFDASKISMYLFADEPEWLRQKRIADTHFYPSNAHAEFTNEDDIKIQEMFYRGCTDDEIAVALKRTSQSITLRRHTLNLLSGRWSEREIRIVKDNSRYMTVDELLKLLPNRTPKGIRYICEKFKIPYHVVKEKCETRK